MLIFLYTSPLNAPIILGMFQYSIWAKKFMIDWISNITRSLALCPTILFDSISNGAEMLHMKKWNIWCLSFICAQQHDYHKTFVWCLGMFPNSQLCRMQTPKVVSLMFIKFFYGACLDDSKHKPTFCIIFYHCLIWY